MLVQGGLLLLRKSLQLKAAHFMRCVESELLQELLAKLEQSVRDILLSLIDRPQSQVDVDQLYLPFRFGGIGLQRWTPDSVGVCEAGYLAAAALRQQALQSCSQIVPSTAMQMKSASRVFSRLPGCVFRHLCAALLPLRLCINPVKCKLYCADAAGATETADNLGSQADTLIVIAGTPIGQSDRVLQHVSSRASSTEVAIDKLMDIRLS